MEYAINEPIMSPMIPPTRTVDIFVIFSNSAIEDPVKINVINIHPIKSPTKKPIHAPIIVFTIVTFSSMSYLIIISL